MLSTRIYYTVKPYIPWRVRITMRRISAQRKLVASRHAWPIQPNASKPPADWAGWPQGKRFALVLTHDVEGAEGLRKCRELAALEEQLGFRSCFNFIPEGPYRVTPEYRAELAAKGFEVGVHDLKHDGKLFQSRRAFLAHADRINRYIREWGAAGFRAGFMLRNLDWLHDLEIAYDSSTFDTDPFELQSDGVGTIFPFWIDAPAAGRGRPANQPPSGARARGGYVELPYTLPQDSTLFLVLRERSPEIWIRKLDWVARHGGMAMVNVHPDYMGFGGNRGAQEYPADHYARLLQYVREKYGADIWNGTPREVANWVLQSRRASRPVEVTSLARPLPPPPPPALRGRKAAVLLYSNYPSDPRPRRAAEAMVEAGMDVDLLCLGDPAKNEPAAEQVAGVNVRRVHLVHRRDGKLTYLWQYGRFFWSSLWFLTTRGLRRRYDIVHVHNMPDFLVFAAVLPRLRGASVVLDLHDPMPELMMSIYRLQEQDWRVGVLRSLERRSIAFSHLALTPNQAFKDVFVSRGCPPDKMQIVMNSPEERIFDPDRYPETDHRRVREGEFHVMHHGSILHRHGIDLLVAAVALLRRRIPGVHLHIYGRRDHFLDRVLQVAEQVGVADVVHYHGSKTQEEIAAAIRDCDVGVIPNRLSPFTRINFPTRLFEYLCMRRPVIAPATQGIGDYFGPDDLLTFEAENISDLAAKLQWVHDHPDEVRRYVDRGAAVYRRHLWSNEKAHLAGLTASVLPPR